VDLPDYSGARTKLRLIQLVVRLQSATRGGLIPLTALRRNTCGRIALGTNPTLRVGFRPQRSSGSAATRYAIASGTESHNPRPLAAEEEYRVRSLPFVVRLSPFLPLFAVPCVPPYRRNGKQTDKRTERTTNGNHPTITRALAWDFAPTVLESAATRVARLLAANPEQSTAASRTREC